MKTLQRLIWVGIWVCYCSVDAVSWSAATDLSTAGQDAFEPQIAMNSDGLKAVVVWRRFNSSNYIIQSTDSTNGGSSWSIPDDLSVAGQNAFIPQIAMSSDGTAAIAVWKRSNGSNNIIQSSYSTNTGTTWSVPIDLSTIGQDAGVPQIAMSSDGLQAISVWTRFDGSNFIVQSSYSTNSGTSWSASTDLSVAGQHALGPQIAVSSDGAKALAIWIRSNGSNNIVQIYRSTDGGASWGAPIDLSAVGQSAFFPQLAMDSSGTNAIAIWYRNNGSNNIIQTSYSTDSGASWSTPINLTATGLDAGAPEVTMSSDGLKAMAVWYRSNGSNDIVQTSYSTDSGASWSASINLSASGQNASSPQIAMNSVGSKAVAIWVRSDGSNDIIQAVSTADGGITWNSSTDLSAAGQDATTPQIVMNSSGSRAIAIWSRLNDDGNTIIQSANLISLFPPAAANGSKVRDQFAFQSFYCNLLNWRASPSIDVQKYLIYRGSTLIAIVSAGTFEYRDQPVSRTETIVYTIKSSNGIDESDGVYVTIP